MQPQTKLCRKCECTRPIDHFLPAKDYVGGRKHTCRSCVTIYTRGWRDRNRTKTRAAGKKCRAKSKANDPVKATIAAILNTAKHRAAAKGVPFELKISDVETPDICPVLGLVLDYGNKKHSGPSDNSPSIDRVVPSLGYVPSNVIVISHRANRLRSDASLSELRKLVAYSEALAAR